MHRDAIDVTRYAHRQIGVAMLVGLLCVPLLMAVVLVRMPASRHTDAFSAWWLFIPMLLLSLLFASLTITVTRHRLKWYFGIGLIRKSVAIADIQSVALTRTTFLMGWGIRLTMRGWLYNVGGFDALSVTLRNGKVFLLGTDEPSALLAAVRHAMAESESHTRGQSR